MNERRIKGSLRASLGLGLMVALPFGPAQAQIVLDQSLPEQPSIVGGSEVKSCAWPSAAVLILTDPNAPKEKSTYLCTASLIHPEIIITAAHCFDKRPKIRGLAFTESYKMLFEEGAKKLVLEVDSCKSHPKWVNDKTTQGRNVDFAYCKLKKPVKDVPIVPPLMGCELDELKAGSEITLVGYGQRSGAEGSPPGDKAEVKTTFNGLTGTGEAQVGSQGNGACYGDSGGPAYINLKDKFGKDAGWRVFGVTSFGPRGCPGPATYGMLNTFIEFVEKDSKIDVTPCFDAKGKWDPNENCKAAPLNPRQSKGSWLEETCEHGPLGGWISTCGDPAGGDGGGKGKDKDEEKEKDKDSDGESEGDTAGDSESGEDPKDDESDTDSEGNDEDDEENDDENEETEGDTEEEEEDNREDSDSGEKNEDPNSKPKGDDTDEGKGNKGDEGLPQPPKRGCAVQDTGSGPWSLLFGLGLAVFAPLRRRR